MTNPHTQEIAQCLVDWFKRCGKDYPWRRTRDPWAILVSEIMLQQTTIPTVLSRYDAWMAQFPTPQALAAVSEDAALRSWEGLGYYRRVRALRAAAIAIVEQFNGEFPTRYEDILSLPGVGEYTAGAVLSFAWNKPAPIVDANVSRVFSRLCNDFTPIDSPAGKRAQWELASQMVHPTAPRLYNSALMELGQTICTPASPACIICPVRAYCLANDPTKLPIKLPQKETLQIEHHDLWLITAEGLLMEKQAEGTRHAGMYRLPQRPADAVQGLLLMGRQHYNVTRYHVTRYLYLAEEHNTTLQPGEEFISLRRLGDIPMASPDRKIIERYLEKPTI